MCSKCKFHSKTCVSCACSGGEWTVLSEEVTDSCYVVKDLPRGASYVFRMGCITKTGAGPFSDASAPVVIATHPEGKYFTFLQFSIWDQANTWRVTVFSPVFTLLYRDSHSSHPDWVTGVKGHRLQTTNHPQKLQFPLRDQQVGFLSRSCNFRAKLSVTSLLFIMINIRI